MYIQPLTHLACYLALGTCYFMCDISVDVFIVSGGPAFRCFRHCTAPIVTPGAVLIQRDLIREIHLSKILDLEGNRS